MSKLLTVSLGLLLLSGCAAYGVIDNAPLTESTSAEPYSIISHAQGRGSGDIELTLAFSGGGTRAAAKQSELAAPAGRFRGCSAIIEMALTGWAFSCSVKGLLLAGEIR